jgi:hypothetical protein
LYRRSSDLPGKASGIFAETQVLRWEQQEELQELDEHYARHPPASPEARCFTASPRDSGACACALQQGDRTFTRLQHRINSARRAFHTALKELERFEARDRGAVMVTPASVSPVTQTPETQLQVLGSLRKNDSADPAAGEMPPRPSSSTSPSANPFSVSADRQRQFATLKAPSEQPVNGHPLAA